MDKYFRTPWAKWKLNYLFNSKTYMFRRKGDVWEDINVHPFDVVLDQLAQIYVDASSTEKNVIEEYVKKRARLSWALVLYIRRIALRLQYKKDDTLAFWALEIALLVLKTDDFRDILNSLVLLKVGAEKIGLDLKSLYNKIDPSCLTNSKSIFYKAENQPSNSIIYIIKNFGPPEWAFVLHNKKADQTD
jgi:hypothetical protein